MCENEIGYIRVIPHEPYMQPTCIWCNHAQLKTACIIYVLNYVVSANGNYFNPNNIIVEEKFDLNIITVRTNFRWRYNEQHTTQSKLNIKV